MNRANLLDKIIRQTNLGAEQATLAFVATLQGLVTSANPPAPDLDDPVPNNDPKDIDDLVILASIAIAPPSGGDHAQKKASKVITPPPPPSGQSISAYVAAFAKIPNETAVIVVALTLGAFAEVGVLDR